jgi:hypothetical protein
MRNRRNWDVRTLPSHNRISKHMLRLSRSLYVVRSILQWIRICVDLDKPRIVLSMRSLPIVVFLCRWGIPT